MRIVACDDEEFFLDQLETYCRDFESETGISIDYHKFDNGEDALEDLRRYPETDLLILDIKMPGKDGVEIAQELRNRKCKTRIIFLTGIIDYVLEGYEIGISRYWMKPIPYSKFKKEMENISNEIYENSRKYIIEHTGGVIEKIPFENIIYIETVGRKTRFHRKDGVYESTTTMTAYEKKLDESFFRCHAAYIVNLSCVVKIQGTDILLENGDTVYVSKAKRKAFVEAFHKYMKNK